MSFLTLEFEMNGKIALKFFNITFINNKNYNNGLCTCPYWLFCTIKNKLLATYQTHSYKQLIQSGSQNS